MGFGIGISVVGGANSIQRQWGLVFRWLAEQTDSTPLTASLHPTAMGIGISVVGGANGFDSAHRNDPSNGNWNLYL